MRTSVPVRIFASHPVAQHGYAVVLAKNADIRLVSGNGAFGVGVFDGDQPQLDQAVRLARLAVPAMRPLVVTEARDQDEYLRWILKGFWAVVPYSRYEQDLARAVRHVCDGQIWFPPQVVIRWMQVDAVLHLRAQAAVLTDREREVVELLVRRLSNKEIAHVLRIAERTVKFHVGNVLAKLQIDSRQELAAAWLSRVRSA
jgi:DNA-binding NarL/FixJ family response regulator